MSKEPTTAVTCTECGSYGIHRFTQQADGSWRCSAAKACQKRAARYAKKESK
jgi:hypothetical protein